MDEGRYPQLIAFDLEYVQRLTCLHATIDLQGIQVTRYGNFG